MNPTAAPPPAPRLFDRALLRARLARATASSQAADFLLVRAADDLGERLAAVTRTFDKALDLATPGPHFADQLHASGKAAFIARAPAIPCRPHAETEPDARPAKRNCFRENSSSMASLPTVSAFQSPSNRYGPPNQKVTRPTMFSITLPLSAATGPSYPSTIR